MNANNVSMNPNGTGESTELKQAAADLGRMRRFRRKVWTGYLASGQRAWRGRKVIMPDGRVASIYGVVRGIAGLIWDDPAGIEGVAMKLLPVDEIKPFKSPAAVLMGKAKRGVRERPSIVKTIAARSNGLRPPGPGKQRGRPRRIPAT